MNQQNEQMSLYEACRWSALIDAVNIIGERCDEKNAELEKYLNPLSIQHYVDFATDEIFNKYAELDQTP